MFLPTALLVDHMEGRFSLRAVSSHQQLSHWGVCFFTQKYLADPAAPIPGELLRLSRFIGFHWGVPSFGVKVFILAK